MRKNNVKGSANERFWNVVEAGADKAELYLYGEIVSQKPTNWKGETLDMLCISPEGFLEDLARLKDKKNITVKLNSTGGDLFTGIAIHNALSALNAEIIVEVEGIAASAASVIMCAGDTVKVHKGSLVMIHGVKAFFFGSMGITEMQQAIKAMESAEKAVAAIYAEKTGVDSDTLHQMITEETWMTGEEAVAKGFADELMNDVGVDMSVSADHKLLIVNGLSMSLSDMNTKKIPGFDKFRIMKASVSQPKADTNINHSSGNQPEKGDYKMTLEELKASAPELVAEIEQAAMKSAGGQAAEAERKRLCEIDEIAGVIADADLIQEAKYGATACDAKELAFRAFKKERTSGNAFLANFQAGAASPTGANQVSAIPAVSDEPKNDVESMVKDIVNVWKEARK